MKLPNGTRPPGKEEVEGRTPLKRNPAQQSAPRTQGRTNGADHALERVRNAASRDKTMQFTSLLHHVSFERLKRAFWATNPEAMPGVDEVTWEDYRENLDSNLEDLYERIHRGGYQPKPSRRAYIPKPDGGLRPLGVAALEDKIVQRAVAEVLGAIYEVDFTGFSYGFRPGRKAHDALDALAYGIKRMKVNWVLDADIRGYFDAIPHDRLMQYVERRIGDPRILRLLRRWLKAGVIDGAELRRMKKGSPQGASISPLLANIYLHYVFDTWAHNWRRRGGRREVIIVRFADDFVVGFQSRRDAGHFLTDLRARLTENELEMHPDKTRLIEFGRFARRDRQRRGEGKPETFDFLGFTHICAVNKKKGFLLRRHTIASRLRRKLQEIKAELRRRINWPLHEVGSWLRAVLNGYYNYFAVPTNLHRLSTMCREVAHIWLRTLRRRGQRDRTTWKWFKRHAEHWLPNPHKRKPRWPDERMAETLQRLTQGRSRMR